MSLLIIFEWVLIQNNALLGQLLLLAKHFLEITPKSFLFNAFVRTQESQAWIKLSYLYSYKVIHRHRHL